MNIVKPSFEIIEQQPGFTGMKKHIELAGRTCYKSLDKITDDSCDGFVQRMIDSEHTAMLEHGTVYLTIPKSDNLAQYFVGIFSKNKYSKVHYNTPICDTAYITTNYRVIIENKLEETLKYISEPTGFHEKRYTVRYTANIHFYKDCTRHRVFSWAIESTRFCNYIKEKFGHSVSFIEPCWLKDEEREEFYEDLSIIEKIYFKWIEKGWQAQQAATFLPQATKAEVIMTGFASDWVHFFDLRAIGTTGAPHPQVKEIVEPLMNEFINRGYINQFVNL